MGKCLVSPALRRLRRDLLEAFLDILPDDYHAKAGHVLDLVPVIIYRYTGMLPDETLGQRILKACREGLPWFECPNVLWMVYNSLALAANLPFTMLAQHLWQAMSAYLRHAEMGHSDAECLEYVLAAAGTVHGKWAKALMDEGDLAMQATDVDFLSCWESERLRREAGKEASETRSKLVHADDVAAAMAGYVLNGCFRCCDTEGLDPDCFRLESRLQLVSAQLLLAARLRPPEQFDFLRRRWRLLYWKVPDQVTYFAEKGPGLEEQSVETVWNELVPLAVNQDMTLCKFNQRLQLSFSETRADTGLSVRLEEVLRGQLSLRICFCVALSPNVHEGAAEAVAAKLGFDEVPSAFQARCGPWKGLWVLDPQLGPGLSCEAEEELNFSFEVINTSSRHWHCCLTANSIQALLLSTRSYTLPLEVFPRLIWS
ncbi:unnamed protein product [Symbiodinium sp. KB8]|nr:unnamed protein product [Symbiodinium sp. KB8]